ncbi:MAG: hypothetical protein KDN22_08290 [Verrucomicrobiae bacterium]|nr:hypothetical protein [Verrucomicrobiae bacterium]
MKHLLRVGSAITSALLALQVAASGLERTQTIELVEGWNCVWLEVDPDDSAENVFSGYDIETVAAFFPSNGPVEFIEDPGEAAFNADGWSVWYSNDEADQGNLDRIHGNRAYLIKATASIPSFSVTGVVRFHEYLWVPDSFNLVGFCVETGDEPTFGEFFAPASAHPSNRIFKLGDNNQWVGVSASEALENGKAYWVYSAGQSRYQRPLTVSIDGIDSIDYGTGIVNQELLISNLSEASASYKIERVGEPNGLELIKVDFDPSADPPTEVESAALVDFTFPEALPARTSRAATIRVDRGWSTEEAEREQLYKISSADTGTCVWLPIRATRADLIGDAEDLTAASGNSGLWVGEVRINQVARIREPDPENNLEPTKYGASMRVIVHVDGSGQARLLKAVTMMRTKTVDGIDPKFVLVTRDEKIPFFEGIERRSGKLVGRRIETVSYDLPRDVADPNIILDQTTANQTPEFKTELDLTGAVGLGKTLKTMPNTLVLDKWHRSNPYRHAFHPDHRSGFRIKREMQFNFHDEISEEVQKTAGYGVDVLTGDYRESIVGLVKPDQKMWVAGAFAFRRISTVEELNQ